MVKSSGSDSGSSMLGTARSPAATEARNCCEAASWLEVVRLLTLRRGLGGEGIWGKSTSFGLMGVFGPSLASGNSSATA